MLLGGMTIYVYIVMYGDYAGEAVCFLVHTHLKDTLRHLQTEWHMQEMMPPMMGIEYGQVGRPFLKVNAPEAILSIQFTEAGTSTE